MKRSRSHPERPASAGDALRENEESFRLLFANNPLPMWVYDLETLRFLEVNDAAVAHYGYTREEFLGMHLTDIRPPEDVERLLKDVHRERSVFQYSGEWRHRLKDGRIIDVEITSHTLEFAGRKAALVVAQDITERKQAEEKIRGLNRVYSVLSGIDEAIVHIRDRQGLFDAACRVAVEHGFFRMAWIGLLDAESRVVKPVACAGVKRSCLAKLCIRADESPEGRGPTGTAIREGRLVVCNDIEHDPQMTPWREEALHNGYRSSAAFPLRLGERVIGALALYASEPFFFDKDEVKLLEALAADISFALQAMEHEEYRTLAEEALAHSEQKYRTLVEQIPAITYMTAVEEPAHTVYISPQVEAVLGFAQGEWLADPRLWSKCIHPDDRAGVLAEFSHTLSTGEPLFLEYRMLARDGQVRWVHDEATVVHDASGKPLFLHGVVVDITERKRVEEALQKSEEQFRSVWENATDGMRLTDGEGMVVAVNESFCRIVGKPRAEIEGQLMSGVYAREDRDRILRKHCERFASRQVPPHLERYVTLWDGRKVWLEVSNCFLETGSSRPLLLGVFRDATPRRQVEEALRESEERFRGLVENAAVGIYRTTPEGKVVMANPTLVRMLGYGSFEDLAARDLEAEGFEPTYPRSAFRERLEAAGTVTGIEAAWKRRDGSLIFVRESARAIRGDDGKTHYYDGIVEDVTEQKRAEEALRESEGKFRALAETAGSAIFIFRGGRFLYVNRAAQTMSGYTEAELLSMCLWDIIHPDYRELVQERALARHRGEPVPQRYDLQILTKKGEARWMDFTAGMIVFEGQPAELGTAFDITERKHAEEALRESEAKFRTLADTASSAIFIFRGERFLYVNRAAEAATGYPQAELLALRTWDIVHPDFQDMVRERALTRLRDVSLPSRYDFKILTKGGEERWVDFTAGVITFEGEPAAVGTAFDITERKQAEEALRRSFAAEQRARQVSETLRAGSLTMTQSLDLSAVLKASLEALAALIPCDSASIMLLENESHLRAYACRGFEERGVAPMSEDWAFDITGRPHAMTAICDRKSVVLADVRECSTWIQIPQAEHIRSWMGIPLMAGGKVLGLYCVDATEPSFFTEEHVRLGEAIAAQAAIAIHNARLLNELRQSEARHRELFEHATYGIYRASPEGDFLDVNPALVHMLGYNTREEVLALNLATDVYRDPTVRPGVLDRVRKEGRIVGVEVEWRRRDGSVILVRTSGRGVFDAQGRFAYTEVIAEDVTQRRALEKQVAALQKFDAIGRLAGGIAHDFNNVIGAIIGWAELSLDEVPPESRLHSHLQKIRKQAERAAGLTRQLLAFARRQLLEPRNLNLNEIITETLGLLEKVIGKDIEIRTTLLPGLWTTCADRSQLEQVLMNLCLNARDAMPTGGTLVIETHNTQVDDEYCRLHPYAKPGDYVTLVISDSGVGMDAATIEHIFEPFFSTKEPGKGTGLGLATAYGIVKQHGGFVNVYSEPGHGSVFRVYLPAVAAAATREDRAAIETVRGGTETILVAEDHEGVFEMVREILGKNGYRTLLARDGEQAVELFRQHQQEIALALLDVVMPKLSGPEAYVQISALRANVPVIFTTGYTSETAQLNMLPSKGAVILQKPYSPNALLRKIREVLDAPR